ncbi:MAG: hypothetical protein OXQ29_16865, partial [Rhodospirillaceae bacterium]|nr:hypothetical protein [Rhodospirillaceae bacterium]
TEMHERFSGVHQHLDAVYDDVMRAFDVILKDDREQFEAIVGRLEDGRARLAQVAGMLLDTQYIVVDQLEGLRQALVRLQLAPCLRLYGSPTDGDPMTLRVFRDCRAQIETLDDLLPDLQLTNISSTASVAAWLDARPDLTMQLSFLEFKRLLAHTGGPGKETAARLPESIVGPEAWFAVADLHDAFLGDHPEHALREWDGDFAASMRTHRANLIAYANSVRDELAAYQQGARRTVFSLLLENAWNGTGMLRPGESLEDFLNTERFADIERNMTISGAHLRSWLTLALQGALDRSDAALALASGRVGFPSVRATFEAALRRQDASRMRVREAVDFSAWAAKQLADGVERLGDELRSERISDALTYGGEHRLLTRTRFDTLDGYTR